MHVGSRPVRPGTGMRGAGEWGAGGGEGGAVSGVHTCTARVSSCAFRQAYPSANQPSALRGFSARAASQCPAETAQSFRLMALHGQQTT